MSSSGRESSNSLSESKSNSSPSLSSSSNSPAPPEKKKETEAEIQFRIALAKDEAKIKFSYENLVDTLIKNNQSLLFDDHGVFLAHREGAFIHFGFSMLTEADKKAFYSSESRDLGWKVHVAIDDSEMDNLAKGFNIIKDFIINEELYCKVVMPGEDFFKESKDDDDRNGRQVTLYVCSDPEKDWENILRNIEDKLIDENIKFTHTAKGDNPIQGSLMMGYRNDDNGFGKYISAKDSGYNFNYTNAPDKILSYDLSPVGVKFHSR